jgi:hypothetical protein
MDFSLRRLFFAQLNSLENQMSNGNRDTAGRKNSPATQPLRGYSFEKFCVDASVSWKVRRPVAE